MSKMKGELRLDIGQGWLVRYRALSDIWMDFKVESLDKDKDKGFDGYVKWDGCMEVDLGPIHFCGLEDIEQLSPLLVKLHELCLLLPRVDRLCAGYKEDEKEP